MQVREDRSCTRRWWRRSKRFEHPTRVSADGVQQIAAKGKLYALEFEGRRYDAGNKLEFLQATVDLALARADLGPAFRSYLEHVLRLPVTR